MRIWIQKRIWIQRIKNRHGRKKIEYVPVQIQSLHVIRFFGFQRRTGTGFFSLLLIFDTKFLSAFGLTLSSAQEGHFLA